MGFSPGSHGIWRPGDGGVPEGPRLDRLPSWLTAPLWTLPLLPFENDLPLHLVPPPPCTAPAPRLSSRKPPLARVTPLSPSLSLMGPDVVTVVHCPVGWLCPAPRALDFVGRTCAGHRQVCGHGEGSGTFFLFFLTSRAVENCPVARACGVPAQPSTSCLPAWKGPPMQADGGEQRGLQKECPLLWTCQ